VQAKDHNDIPSMETLTIKQEVERAIIQRNQCHSRQSLNTPFAADKVLADSVNPLQNNSIDEILNGTFIDTTVDQLKLTPTKRAWVSELRCKVTTQIDLTITIEDFKQFFKRKQEKTASSPSGRHMGHYKVMLDQLRVGRPFLAEIITTIAQISIITGYPLPRRQRASQVMLEKGKGRYIENLRIIQLVEADLSFVLHVFWGHRLPRHALQHNALNKSQYALPGQTCQNVSWSKALFLDLTRQALIPGTMTDYDATAAFDRVLTSMALITYERMGLPRTASLFMYNLLKNMEFQLITGFGKSEISYLNNADPDKPGQGEFQGSSSAAPIYTMNSDVFLSAYDKLGMGTTFIHPVTGIPTTDKVAKYVDDKTQFLNCMGAQMKSTNPPTTTTQRLELLHNEGRNNTQIWADLLWISGGQQNLDKCFSYSILPQYNFSSGQTITKPLTFPQPIKIINPATGSDHLMEQIHPSIAKRTLGVIMAPNASNKAQLKHTLIKARTFLGHFSQSTLPQRARWIAVQMVVNPSIIYPLMATYFSHQEMGSINSIMSQMQCAALGLIRNFPWAILHRPTILGGLGIPDVTSQVTAIRLNYFLFTIRQQSHVSMKLEISIIITQLEVGVFKQFFSQPFETFGHLTTRTLGTQIWRETEPRGIQLRAAENAIWTPKSQGISDIPIITLALQVYNKKGANMIIRCRLYLNVILIYDLYTYDGRQIHPAFLNNTLPPSLQPTIQWLAYPKPPKHYWSLWAQFIHLHVNCYQSSFQFQ
jgi:hypothetical protein